MSFASKLRNAIGDQVEARANGRAAGEGLWTNYVRALMLDNAPTTADQFDEHHTALIAVLEDLRPMTKEEKNSLTSAKCVLKGAVVRELTVWKMNADGSYEHDGEGVLIPRGKSDLQNAKSDYEMVMQMLTRLTKKISDEDREPFTKEQLDTIAGQLLVVSEAVMNESKATA